MKNIISLFLWGAVSFSAGWFGSQFKPGSWYQSLLKPSWTPPSLAFPIAWAILYAMMSVAAWLVWKKIEGNSLAGTALAVFVSQLVLNAAWSWIFFGRHEMGWALFEIIGLWLTIVVTTYLFSGISVAATLLMLPYLLWVSFAALLNWAIWRIN